MTSGNLLVAQFENPGVGLISTNNILNFLDESGIKYEVVECSVFARNSFLAVLKIDAEILKFENYLDTNDFTWIQNPHPELLPGLYSLQKVESSDGILVAQSDSFPNLVAFIDSNLKANSIKLIDVFSGRGHGGSPVLYAEKIGALTDSEHTIEEIQKLNTKLRENVF